MQKRLEDRELNQARSKPATVDRPVRTARIFVHHYNSTEDVHLHMPALQIGTHFLLTLERVVSLSSFKHHLKIFPLLFLLG